MARGLEEVAKGFRQAYVELLNQVTFWENLLFFDDAVGNFSSRLSIKIILKYSLEGYIFKLRSYRW
jgi:hypothetical protein